VARRPGRRLSEGAAGRFRVWAPKAYPNRRVFADLVQLTYRPYSAPYRRKLGSGRPSSDRPIQRPLLRRGYLNEPRCRASHRPTDSESWPDYLEVDVRAKKVSVCTAALDERSEQGNRRLDSAVKVKSVYRAARRSAL